MTLPTLLSQISRDRAGIDLAIFVIPGQSYFNVAVPCRRHLRRLAT